MPDPVKKKWTYHCHCINTVTVYSLISIKSPYYLETVQTAKSRNGEVCVSQGQLIAVLLSQDERSILFQLQ